MKFTVEMGVLIGLLVLSIGISLLNVGAILPYSSQREYQSCEGFKEGGTSDRPTDEIPLNLKEAPGVENPSDYEDNSVVTKNKSVDSSKKVTFQEKEENEEDENPSGTSSKKYEELEKAVKNVEILTNNNKNKTEEKSKEGMTSRLQPSPTNTASSLDMYSLSRGSQSCTPSPYSNSQGYLCMNPEQVKLLSTRGGNQTGGAGLNVSPA